MILERFFGPVLDWPSYAAPRLHDGPRRSAPRSRLSPPATRATYISEAARYPLYTWDRQDVLGRSLPVIGDHVWRLAAGDMAASGSRLAAGQVS